MKIKQVKFCICDSCGEAKGDHEYVGYDMLFCQACIDEHLVRSPKGFRFKTPEESEVWQLNKK